MSGDTIDTILARDSMQRMTEAAQRQARAHTTLAWVVCGGLAVILAVIIGMMTSMAAQVGEMRAYHKSAFETAITQADEARRAANRIEDKVRDIRKRLPPTAGGGSHGKDE